MASWLKRAALWGGGLLVAWAAVVTTWLLRSHEPSSSDLFWGLIAFPAFLAAAYFLLKWALGTILSTSSATSTASIKESSGDISKPFAGGPGLLSQTFVLGGAVKVSAGDAQALLQACADGVRPELDSQLRDEQGFPLLAARVSALDETDVLDWWDGAALDEALPQGRAWVAQLSTAHQRELRLLAEVLAESMLLVEQQALPALEDFLRAASAPVPDGSGPESAKSLRDVIPALKVQLLLEQSWAEGEQCMLLAWAREWLAQLSPGLRFELGAKTADSEPDAPWPAALLNADAASVQGVAADLNEKAQIWILAAAHSSISSSKVDSLAAQGQLFSSRRREGLIAGEGAAALVLLRHRPQAQSAIFAAELPFAAVAGSMSARPYSSADELLSLLVPVLTAGNVDASAISKIVSDADHRAYPTMQTAMLVSQRFADLSLEEDCSMIGQPCGHIGEVAALAVWILAAQLSVRELQPTLALMLSPRAWHGVALFFPPGKALVTADGFGERVPKAA